jgi:preprotein translocase subunit SecG
MGYFLLTLLMLVGFFLMFVILLQRGRGGGLAGAFGGLGGQSAFGTKAGDVFTVITIVTVVIWVVLACITGWRLRVEANSTFAGRPDVEAREPAGEADRDATTGDEKEEADQAAADKKKTGSKKETRGEAGDEESPTLDSKEAGSRKGKENSPSGSGDKPETPSDDGASEKPSGELK